MTTASSYIKQYPRVLAILRDNREVDTLNCFWCFDVRLFLNRTGNQTASCIRSFWLQGQKDHRDGYFKIQTILSTNFV